MKNFISFPSVALVFVFFSQSIFANGTLASTMGNITGGACTSQSDCIVGCRSGDESRPSCLSKTEGSTKCVEGKLQAPGGLACVCLADVKSCGYAFPQQLPVACAPLGAGLSPKGSGPPGSSGFSNECCVGLKHVENKSACGKAYGGYAGQCVACGDGNCDSRFENHCNCPKDCPKN